MIFKQETSQFIVLTILRKSEKFDDMRILILRKMLTYIRVKMPVGFTNVTSSRALTSKFVNT